MKRGETSKCKKVTEKVKDKINRDVRFILKDKDVVQDYILAVKITALLLQ